MGDKMEIDIEKLRKDLIEHLEGAFFIGGFGAAMIDMEKVKRASSEEVIQIAIQNGFDIEDYKINYKKKKKY